MPFVVDELQQLLNDEGGMADLNLTRKLAVSSPPVTDSSVPDAATIQEENDVEELECCLRHFEQTDHGKQYAHELPLAIRLLGKSCLGIGIMWNNLRNDAEDYINIRLELILMAGTITLSVYSFFGGCNIWHEHPRYMERRP
ncbi:hypothetical protein CUMW_166890 [Citrus unshiu]|uniref:Uncharacterized protein n=1 Tax=Citrus unshiu TaxID=55188 RepID=A0A2H5PTY1_CITUN|nr:hypothetical protein CUMW_166890 [Citrus unshiu]